MKIKFNYLIIYNIQMSLVQNNPFNKANPFKSGQFDKFHHAHLPTSNPTDYAHLIYHDSYKLQHSRATINNWVFNDNNLTKKVDFNRKYQLNKSQVSEFQMHMKVSAVYNHPKNQTKIVEQKQGKLQNPFHRKNLIIDKDTVVNQVEADLSLFRKKSNTTYEKPVTRISFGTTNVIEQSPTLKNIISHDQYSERDRYLVDQTRVPQVSVESPNPLSYSKTPQMTHRETNRETEYIPPKTISFKRKTFFLKNPIND